MLKINYDALGIAASVACAIHCALLPLVLTSLPVLGINIINNTWFEVFMILLAAAIGSYSLTHGYRKHHHSKKALLIFALGILMLILKQLFHPYQLWFLVPAMLLIVSAHYINYRQCRNESVNCVHKI
jgi:hypothetical protein